MKKNLISVVILALVFANFVLTALLMFSVLPETKKANTLIEKVCSAIDLDLNSGAATGTSNVSIDDQEIYKVSTGEDLTTNLAEGKDGKTHYAVLNVSLVLNKKSDNYKKYTQDFLTNQDDTIKNDIIKVITKYMDIDREGLDIQITQTESEGGNGSVPVLCANIPVRDMKKRS